MILDEIADRLTSTGVLAAKAPGSTSTLAWTVYKSFMPPEPDKAIAIVERTGDTPFTFGMNQPSVQVRVRGAPINESATAYGDARATIENVKVALHGMAPQTLSPAYYAGLWAEQSPFSLGLDANNRPELAINFRALRAST